MTKSLSRFSPPAFAKALVTKDLTFLAHEPELFSRFLDLTGLNPGEIRGQVKQRSFQCAVLDYLLSDESLLLTFCSNNAVDPETIQPVYQAITSELESE